MRTPRGHRCGPWRNRDFVGITVSCVVRSGVRILVTRGHRCGPWRHRNCVGVTASCAARSGVRILVTRGHRCGPWRNGNCVGAAPTCAARSGVRILVTRGHRCGPRASRNCRVVVLACRGEVSKTVEQATVHSPPVPTRVDGDQVGGFEFARPPADRVLAAPSGVALKHLVARYTAGRPVVARQEHVERLGLRRERRVAQDIVGDAYGPLSPLALGHAAEPVPQPGLAMALNAQLNVDASRALEVAGPPHERALGDALQFAPQTYLPGDAPVRPVIGRQQPVERSGLRRKRRVANDLERDGCVEHAVSLWRAARGAGAGG